MPDIQDRYELDVSGLVESINKVKQSFDGLQKEVVDLKDTNKETFSDVGKNVDKTASAFDGLGESIGSSITELGILQGGTARTIAILKSKIQALNGVRSAFLGTSKSLGVFRAALVSTGIGAILLILAGLINALSRVDKVMDFLSATTAGLTAGFERFGDLILGIGQNLLLAFTNPVQALKNIVGIFSDFGQSVGEAAKQAFILEQALDALDDRRIAFIEEEARLTLEVAKNREILSDTESTLEEKQAAIIALRKNEKALNDELIAQQRERVRITQAQLDINTSDKAAVEAVQEEKAKLLRLEADAENAKRKINKEEKKVLAEQRRANQEFIKQQEEKKKKAQELKKAYQDIAQSVRDALQAAEVDTLIGADRINAEKNIAIRAIDELEKKAREAAKAAGQTFSNEDFVRLRILTEQKAQQELEKLANQQALDAIEKEKEKAKLISELLSVSTDELLTLEEQRQALALEAERAALEKRLAEQRRFYEETGLIQTQAVQDELAILELNIQKVSDSESALREAARQRQFDERAKAIDDQRALAESELSIIQESADATLTLEQFKEQELLRIRKEAAIQELALLEERFGPDSQQAKLARNGVEALNQQIADTLARSSNPFDQLGEFLKEALQIDDTQLQAIKDTVGAVAGAVGDFISTNTDIAIEENNRLLDEIRNRISETEDILKEEEERAAKGYSNNVESKRAELEELKRLEAARVAEDQRLKQDALRQQLIADTASQASNLVTSITGILSGAGKLGPILGPILAAAGILSIISLFRRYKSESKNLASQRAYKGGSLANYMTGERDSGMVAPGASSDQPGKGRGLRVEGTDLVIGGDEYLVRASSAKKYAAILDQINAGTYNPQFSPSTAPAMAKPKALRKTYRILQERNEYQTMAALLHDHSRRLIEYDKNKPTKLFSGDKIIEINKGKTKIIKI